MRRSVQQSVTSAGIINTPLIKPKGLAHLKVGNEQAEMRVFSSSDILARTLKNRSSHDVTGSLAKNLVNSFDLQVTVGPLSLASPAAIKPLVLTSRPGAMSVATPNR